jgi:hypothetical protein
VAKAAQDGLRMQPYFKPCQQQLARPPDLVTDRDGVSYLLFESVLCGRQVILRLDSEGEIDGEFTHLNGSVRKTLGASANSAAFIDLPGPQT